MPKAVIVPIEGDAPSERALAPATALAWRAHADLILVHVAPGREQAVERDGEFKAALAGSGLSGEVVIRWRADPARVIREVADVSGPDAVICMATRAPGRLGGVVLGSTAEAVTREATCPLLLVGPHVLPQRGWPWQELAVCVDGSPASEALLPVAAEWADEMAMEIRLLQVVNQATTRDLRDCYPRLHFRDDSYVRSVAVDLGSIWDTDTDAEILYGARPAPTITSFLESHPTTLPFLGTHGRAGLRRVALGSVATGVVRDSPSPVVVVGTRAGW